MRKGLVLALVFLLAQVPRTWAGGHSNPLDPCEAAPDYCFWFRMDYLYWTVTQVPLPTLVTTGSNIGAGQIGFTDTGVLFGGPQSLDWIQGGRVTAGFWCDSGGTLGMEASAFILQSANADYAISDNGKGNPVISIPYNSTVIQETVLRIANPLSNSGGVSIQNNFNFTGGNVDFVVTPLRTASTELNLFAGFASYYLKEDLSIGSFTIPFTGYPDAGSTIYRNDSFNTRNTFYGGELGARYTCRGGNCFLEMTGKVAFGPNYEVVEISGSTLTVPKTTPPIPALGGLFSAPSNIGSYSRSDFIYVPSGQIRAGIECSSHLKFSVGYDVLYMSAVVRPGNQIDRTIGPTVGGPTHPLFNTSFFQTSPFWAHGASVGMELRF